MLSKLARFRSMLFNQQMKRLMSSTADGHAGHQPNPDFWKKVFFFVSVPAIVLGGINTLMMEIEHYNHYHRAEFIPYEHLRMRKKRFPWGDGNHSLFHNPKCNPLPDGWEEIPGYDDHPAPGHH